MKKYCLLLFLFNIIVSDSIDPFLGKQIDEDQRVIYNYQYGDEWVIGLEDGSYWNLYPLQNRRSQTWYEWWNNTTPQEWNLRDEYFFNPQEWKSELSVSIYKKNRSIFPHCSNIFVNENTKQKIFAEYIPMGSKYIPSIEFVQQFLHSPATENIYLITKIARTSDFLKNLIYTSDKTWWKVFFFQANSRSILQWLYDKNIDQPDPAFISTIDDWSPGDQIQAFFIQEDSSIENKYSLRPNRSLSYVIYNKTKNLYAYVKKISMLSILRGYEEYAKEQWQDGYDTGFSSGQSAGTSSSTQTTITNQ